MANTKNPGNKPLRQPRTPAELHQRLRDLGCVIEPARNGHLNVTLPAPAGGRIQIASTPSDPRNLGNMVTRFRRRGVCVRAMTVEAVS